MPELQSEPAASDVVASDARARWARWVGIGALALSVIAVAILLLTGGDEHRYRFVFDNAGALVKGDIVRVGGTKAGTVEGIELTDDDKAEVTVSLSDEFAPLHQGTTATIRAQSFIGIANRYVDVHPGPNFRDELADGAILGTDDTTAIVELDQLFNALDAPTRKGLQQTMEGFAAWYSGKEAEANKSARYFSPLLVATTNLARELNRDSRAFEDFLVNSSTAMGAIAERRTDLTNLVGNAGATVRALSSDTSSLNQALAELPQALREGSNTFAGLRPALDDLQTLAVESKPATKDLAPFFRDLRPVTERSVPTFNQLGAMFNSPGPANDLYDLLSDMPALARLSESALPKARKALTDSTPIFSFGRPYTPDLVAWIRSFGQAMAPYDANGHYARAMPVFDAYSFVDDAEGGHLEPKPPAQRGSSPYLSYGNLKRCPGSAAPAPSDGSAPFVDMGELANADCDPSQIVRPTP